MNDKSDAIGLWYDFSKKNYGKIGLNYGSKYANVVALSHKSEFNFLNSFLFDDLSADLLSQLDSDYSLIRNSIKKLYPKIFFSYMLDYLNLERFSYN